MFSSYVAEEAIGLLVAYLFFNLLLFLALLINHWVSEVELITFSRQLISARELKFLLSIRFLAFTPYGLLGVTVFADVASGLLDISFKEMKAQEMKVPSKKPTSYDVEVLAHLMEIVDNYYLHNVTTIHNSEHNQREHEH